MSNALSVAAVTATLKALLTKGLSDELGSNSVTSKPPDKVRTGNDTPNQLNIFLYQVTHDAAWLNMNMPNLVRPNESGNPPLPLVLYYLLTAYGDNDDATEPASHRLLGSAMRVLHDHPLLGTDEIRAALEDSDLGDQIERVRITHQPLSVDEMSKLWTTFQTNYRISVGYQVSVVLIESTRQVRTPLPVLTPDLTVQPSLSPPFPTLTSIKMPKAKPSVLLGDTVAIEGFHLDGNSVEARFKHPRLEDPVVIPVDAGGTPTSVHFTLPAGEPDKWATGVYAVSLLVKRAGEQDRVTNTLPMVLGTVITSPMPMTVARDGDGHATVAISCSPDVLPAQRAFVLLSDENARQIPAESRVDTTDQLVFKILNAAKSSSDGFYIRLRVDGVDSLLITDYEARPPVFDPSQKIKIT